MKSRRGIFLDRDGTLNRALVREGRPYPPRTLEDFEILPEVREACLLLEKMGPLIVVTNQPDIARGDLDLREVEKMHRKLCAALPIARVEMCCEDGRNPHSLDYKPAPGMLLRAAAALDLDLTSSVMIGDRWRDVECGRNAGCLTIFIERGYDESLPQPPDHRVADLLEAAKLLVRLSTGDQ